MRPSKHSRSRSGLITMTALQLLGGLAAAEATSGGFFGGLDFGLGKGQEIAPPAYDALPSPPVHEPPEYEQVPPAYEHEPAPETPIYKFPPYGEQEASSPPPEYATAVEVLISTVHEVETVHETVHVTVTEVIHKTVENAVQVPVTEKIKVTHTEEVQVEVPVTIVQTEVQHVTLIETHIKTLPLVHVTVTATATETSELAVPTTIIRTATVTSVFPTTLIHTLPVTYIVTESVTEFQTKTQELVQTAIQVSHIVQTQVQTEFINRIETQIHTKTATATVHQVQTLFETLTATATATQAIHSIHTEVVNQIQTKIHTETAKTTHVVSQIETQILTHTATSTATETVQSLSVSVATEVVDRTQTHIQTATLRHTSVKTQVSIHTVAPPLVDFTTLGFPPVGTVPIILTITSTITVPCTTLPPTCVITQPGLVVPPSAITTHKVIVGGDAGLIYNPPHVIAAVGDIVHFEFMAQNHTVTQSTFDKPCVKNPTGFDSGFLSNPNNTVIPAPSFQYTVTSMAPTWWYCAQATHCGKGMVFAINPTAERTFEAFKHAAVFQTGTAEDVAAPTPDSKPASPEAPAGVLPHSGHAYGTKHAAGQFQIPTTLITSTRLAAIGTVSVESGIAVETTVEPAPDEEIPRPTETLLESTETKKPAETAIPTETASADIANESQAEGPVAAEPIIDIKPPADLAAATEAKTIAEEPEVDFNPNNHGPKVPVGLNLGDITKGLSSEWTLNVPLPAAVTGAA